MRANLVLASLAMAAVMAGCGVAPTTVKGAPRAAAAVVAHDEGDHQQMNALMREVLTAQWPALLATADANKDGVISEAEYKPGRSAEVQKLFLASFDGNGDKAVTAAEYTAAMATDKAVEAFHHFTEERMSAAIKPFMADKNFDVSDLRTYITKDLGQMADWPLLFRIMGELDLNQDEKLISAPGEGAKFMLHFAKPQLQKELGMPASVDEVKAPAKRR